MRLSAILMASLGLSGLLLLAACGGVTSDMPTPTALPTSSLEGLVTVQPRLCRLAELPVLKVDAPQGDLLAWAPAADTLAYLAPTSGSAWMVGTLMTVSGPVFDTPVELADRAAGDLSWSPEGDGLAFISLRRSDNLFSVGVVYPESGNLLDLFPGEAARYDEWSSQKAVLGWTGENRLRVQVSCGLDCVQTVSVILGDGSLSLLGGPLQRAWDWWDYTLNPGEELPEEYQAIMREVNWSPEGGWLVYLDARADAWVASVEQGVQFPLDTGGFLAVSETDWSADGRYLAVQAEGSLFIFGECP